MQALHDHFGAEGEEGGDDDEEEGVKQIWHVGFLEGGLRKVHFSQDQEDIGTERK